MKAFTITFIILFLLSSGCEGPTGPKGEQGISGEQGLTGPQGEQGESGEPFNWADMYEDNDIEKSIYAVVLKIGNNKYLLGTGFSAYYSDCIWTNAHIVVASAQFLIAYSDFSPEILVVRSNSIIGYNDTYKAINGNIHPLYDSANPKTNSPDIGFLVIDGTVSHFLEFLPLENTGKLRIGQPIGTAGFPGEVEAMNTTIPIATFKDGTISALRPYKPEEQFSSPENNHFIQHNLDLSGGTSGSPIFDHYGFVIGINNSGTEEIVVEADSGEPVRVPIGNIGFGIRVDEVWDWIEEMENSGENSQVAKSISPRKTVICDYDPFPPHWRRTALINP